MPLTSMNNSTQISRNAQIDAIWANSKRKDITPVYSETLKELKEMSDEDILSLYSQLPEEVVAEVPVAVLTDSNITAQVTVKGEPYYTIGLPLVETNGLSFKFQHGDAIVVISNDIDLYKLHKANPISVGTIMEFNYSGAETFKKLDAKGQFLVANNDKDNPYRGTLSKSNNAIFSSIIEQKAIAVMERKIALLETADELGVSVRQVRQVLSANLATDISAMMKAKLGK